ncbi:hypothetical protein ACFLZK_00535 [Patescibacteria group bacterium]
MSSEIISKVIIALSILIAPHLGKDKRVHRDEKDSKFEFVSYILGLFLFRCFLATIFLLIGHSILLTIVFSTLDLSYWYFANKLNFLGWKTAGHRILALTMLEVSLIGSIGYLIATIIKVYILKTPYMP